MREMKYNLPKPYLSYSAFDLWNKDKEAFRRRYYYGELPPETAEIIFGKSVHRKLEEDETIIGSETKIEVELDEGLKILGYIDSFDDKTLKIVDFKTSHLDSYGNDPWNKVKVHKHKQLIFYSLLVLLKHGRFNPWTELHWIETRFKEEIREFDGHKLVTKGRELELTGKTKVFKRRVLKWEIEKLKGDIIRTAKEITEDYERRKTEEAHQESHERTGKTLTQEKTTA